MAGGTPQHSAITFNVAAALRRQLRGSPCRGFNGDLRIKVSETGLYTYPDVVVVCGEPQFEDAQVDTLLNPTLIIEVLSRTTEAYDRGKKFAQYRRLETLQEYLLVAQDQPWVERYLRQPDGQWLLSVTEELTGLLPLPSISGELRLAEVYRKVSFPAEGESQR